VRGDQEGSDEMKKLIRFFISGLLFLIPVGITVYVLYVIFNMIAQGMKWGMDKLGVEMGWFGLAAVGMVVLLAVVTFVGMLTSFFVTRPLVQLVEKFFGRLPLLKMLYNSIKDLIGAFMGDTKKFDKPVSVELVPGGKVRALGFVTRESLGFLGMKDQVAVYIPQSYNFAGSVLLVSTEQIQPLSVDSSALMTFVVSGGVSGPEEQKKDEG